MIDEIERNIVERVMGVARIGGRDCSRRGFIVRAATTSFGVLSGVVLFSRPVRAEDCDCENPYSYWVPDAGECPVAYDPCENDYEALCGENLPAAPSSTCNGGCPPAENPCGRIWVVCDSSYACYRDFELPCSGC